MIIIWVCHVGSFTSDYSGGAATFVGAFLGVIGQRPSNRMLAFATGFAAGIMLLISLMEMLPAALHTEGMSPLLGYSMFYWACSATSRLIACCLTSTRRI